MKKYCKSDLQRELREHCMLEYGIAPYSHVYAEICGTPMYLNEIEVRYLQTKCKREAMAGRFDEFCATHKVWNGRTKRGHEPMAWLPSGFFDKEVTYFDSGFYNTTGMLHLEILQSRRQGN